MKIKFDSTQDFQQDAVAAVADLFVGQPITDSPFSVALSEADASTVNLTELGIGNRLILDDDALLTNLRSIQERNGIAVTDKLMGRNFSVEMETGTGKTYVYLRTIFELHKRYGFRKFIIVVPSIPIREGVLKSIDMMREHFFAMYNTRFDHTLYDSKTINRVRSFATANTLQLMVMNIQAFQKDVRDGDDTRKANVINRESDRMNGRRPIEFLQATHPIVVVDEPQKMEGEKAIQAIERLNPLCTLRYSATHKNPYNLVYKLDPIQAYDLRLVKRVEVASVLAEDSVNDSFVRLVEVDNRKALRARVVVNVAHGANVKQKKVWVKRDDDLSRVSKGRYEYANGFIVSDISFNPGSEYIEFTNGLVVKLNQEKGGLSEDAMRAQVYETVKQHLQKEKLAQSYDIKVLSLFFIDRVANYRIYNDDGSKSLGKIGRWFEEAFNELTAK